MNRSSNALIFIGGLFVGTILSSALVSAWTGPSSVAPTSNVAAPINVGSTAQIKNGVLGVNSLAVYGNTILNGTSLYLNFGTTAGTNGYGIRDNAGTLEFKDNAGTWKSVATAINTYNTLNGLTQSAGRVSQIQFSDDTTQTTAPKSSYGGFQVWNPDSTCRTANSFTGACSCPSGYSAVPIWYYNGGFGANEVICLR